jgi:MFS family permease
MRHISTELDHVRPATRIFYGWVVVAGAFFVSLLGFGVAYTFSSFFPPLQQTFAATRGDISFVFALSGFFYFCLGAVSGPLADRLGPRWVTAAGMLCVGVGMLLTSQAQALWQVYVTYGLGIGVGVGFSFTPSLATVQRWFVRRRGFASGIAVAGIGVGTLLFPPLATWLISVVGWRATYGILGIVTIMIGPAAALLLAHSPQRRGLLPDGDSQPEASTPRPDSATAATGSGDDLTLGQALRTRTFWLLYAASFASSLGLFTPFAHLPAYAQDHGLSAGFGALLISLIGVGSTGGRLLMGNGADRLGLRLSMLGMFLGVTVMLLWWVAATGAWALVIFALLFGICYGGCVAILPALAALCFGGHRISSIMGVIFTGVGVGTLLGPGLAGTMYDLSHSYTVPILISAVANLVAALCIWQLRTPTRQKPTG